MAENPGKKTIVATPKRPKPIEALDQPASSETKPEPVAETKPPEANAPEAPAAVESTEPMDDEDEDDEGQEVQPTRSVPPLVPAPPTISPAEFQRQVDEVVCDHLQYLDSMPPDSVEVFLFKQRFPEQFPSESTHAIKVLQQYETQGFVRYGWKTSAGRYSLTEEGKAYLEQLKATLGR